MTPDSPQLGAALDALIDAEGPRAELSGLLMSVAGKAAQPVVEKGLKKLAERVVEAEVLQATAGDVDADGARRLGWKIRIRNHTAVAFAVAVIEVAVGRNASVMSAARTMDMGAPPDTDRLDGRLMICAGEDHCEFWLRTDVGRAREVVPVVVSLRALEGDRKHELKLNLNRADDLGLTVRQAP